MVFKITLIKFFFVFSFLIPYQLFSQRQAENWYFGYNAGVNFSSGVPVAVSGGQTYTNEGVATISDTNGNLLFYTDGITVWNKLHQVMQNGTGLFGNASTTQSAIIVPQPGNDSIYYIFTVDYFAQPHGICYSVVNMNLSAGLGNVITKNTQLLTPTCEKVTAVKHCNKKDIWVITKQFNTDKYYAWLVNSSGISTTPVISATGNIVNLSAGSGNLSVTEGYLKVSPDGKKILAAHLGYTNELGKFDSNTGIISDGIKISTTLPITVFDTAHLIGRLNYGVEFSPNSHLIYIDIGQLYFPTGSSSIPAFIMTSLNQYDITSHDSLIIAQSHYFVDSASYPQFTPISLSQGLQLGIDNKIYRTHSPTNFLSVINNPNVAGAGCNYQNDAVNLGSGISRGGLPSFVTSLFNSRTFTSDNDCSSLSTQFQINNTTGIDSVKWDFNDIVSGINNNSTLTNPIHTFSTPGSYLVSLFIYTSNECGNFIDTLSKNVSANAIHVNLGNDTILCQSDHISLNPGIANASYLWNDSSTDTLLNVFQPGSYWVTVSFQGCFSTDTINIINKPLPQFTLGVDTSICNNISFSLSPEPSFIGASYLWSNNITDAHISVTSSDNYWLLLTDVNGCKWRDTIKVTLMDCNCSPSIPNAFTPNGDGINDKWMISHNCGLPISVFVYNRYGSLVYHSDDYQNDWNGTYRSKACPDGTYYYFLKLIFPNNKNEIFKGNVTILR